MLPKINFVYDRKKNRRVELCVYYGGKRKYLTTGITIPKNATYKNGIISGCANAPMMNMTLNTAMMILQGQLQAQIERDNFDLSAFSLSVTFNNDNFFKWAMEKAETMKVKDATRENHKRSLKKFKEHGVVKFTDLTPKVLNKAVSAMVDEGMNPTSVNTYFGSLRAYVTAAYKEKLIAHNPCPDVILPKGKSAMIAYLTREEVALVENMHVDRLKEKARDMFLFSCYTGLAYSDLVKIKKSDIIYIDGKPYIHDKRQKTGGEYKLRMLPKAMAILKKYNYNLDMMGNANANTLLLRIEKELGLRKHLSMHVGRHTFATLALSSGVRIETVSRMLAHADIKTTQIYAKVLQKDVDEGFDILEDKI